MERGVDPGDQGRPPVGGVQADGAHPQAVEADRQGEERPGEGRHPHAGTRLVGGGQAEGHPCAGTREPGAAAEQGVQAEALQEGGGMVGRGVAVARVRVGAAPGLDRGTIYDEVAGPDQPGAQGLADRLHEEHLVGRRAGSWHSVSTIVRTSRCSPDLCLVTARWYAGGGTGVVPSHGARTIG